MTKDELQNAIRKYHSVVDSHAKSGVADTEGRGAMGTWFERGIENRPTPKVTFKYLEGFDSWEGDKEAVAKAIESAAEELLAVLCAARRQGLFKELWDVMF